MIQFRHVLSSYGFASSSHRGSYFTAGTLKAGRVTLVEPVAYLRDLVTASTDNTARVWDLTGRAVATLEGHQGYINSASFSPDGEQIITASWDNTARVWDLTGRTVATLEGHQDYVFSASFSPDGQHIVTASYDKTARVFPVQSLDQLLTRGCEWLNDYLITHPSELQRLEVCQTPSRRVAAADTLVRAAGAQAKAGNVEAAVATFRQALEWNSELDLNPEAEARRLATP